LGGRPYCGIRGRRQVGALRRRRAGTAGPPKPPARPARAPCAAVNLHHTPNHISLAHRSQLRFASINVTACERRGRARQADHCAGAAVGGVDSKSKQTKFIPPRLGDGMNADRAAPGNALVGIHYYRSCRHSSGARRACLARRACTEPSWTARYSHAATSASPDSCARAFRGAELPKISGRPGN
jgi:hypothetical protein